MLYYDDMYLKMGNNQMKKKDYNPAMLKAFQDASTFKKGSSMMNPHFNTIVASHLQAVKNHPIDKAA